MLRKGRDLSLHDLSAPPAYFEALHARLQDLYACQCEHCQSSAQLSAHTLHLSLEKSFKNHLNKGKTALKTLFDNQGFKPKDLQTEKAYQDLVQSTSDIFELAIQDNDLPDDMRRALASDAFLFGSLKTNAQLFEASKLLTKQDGTLKSFQELTQDFDKLNQRYNQTYLESEYEFAVGSAQMASKWSEFGSSERYYLQYRTAKDERVRASHAALADITLPREDPFWDSFYAPNGWRCRCTVVEVLKSRYEPSNSEDAIKKGEVATTEIGKNGKNRLEIFRFNPGKNEVLFPPKHPYNKVAGAKEVKENLSFKNVSLDDLKEVRKKQEIDLELETNIMGSNGYVGTSNAFDLNEKLRKNKPLSEADNKVVDSLDSLIKRNKLKENVMLYRNDGLGFIESHFNTDIKGLSNEDAIKKLKNSNVSSFMDKGFFSTSTVKNINAFTFRKIHSEIKAKKGTNGFVVDNFSESELILGRNQKFNIIDITEENNKIKIVMETD